MVNPTPAAKQLAKSAFMLSAPNLDALPADEGTEVAFAGRSNSGKSTALNRLCQQRQLARASKTPGRTQLLNCFAVEPGQRLVDLPGYGYAKVPEAMRRDWGARIAEYFAFRDSLFGLVLLVDSRHGLRDLDAQLLAYAARKPLPTLILLSKSDKLARNAQIKAAREARDILARCHPAAEVLMFSAQTGMGVTEAQQWVMDRLTGSAEVTGPVSNIA